MLDLFDELKALISVLNEKELPYAVCGALALAVHGQPRATQDIDLLVPANAMEQVSAVAEARGYVSRSFPMRLAEGSVVIQRLTRRDPDTEDFLSVDLIQVTEAIVDVWRARQRVEWEHGELWVVSPEGLVQLKELRGNAQDLADIQRLMGTLDED